MRLEDFAEIWVADFEFIAPPGHRPTPVCLAATELRSRRTVQQWQGEFSPSPPYSTGPESLFVAFMASAECGCHLALNWPMPANVLDLYPEYRNRFNGVVGVKSGLLDALRTFGRDTRSQDHKNDMRGLVMRGGPWSADERQAILDYCQEDVDDTAVLLEHMAPRMDLPRALLRGRYMAAVARMEWAGVPLDVATLRLLQEHWGAIQINLIAAVDQDFGVYEGTTFKLARFEQYLARNEIPWPELPSGQLQLDDDTFRDMAKSYPCINPLRELRTTLSQMRLRALQIGSDNRNRAMLSPFCSTTGRNQPSNAKFIFGPAVWFRHLIKPEPGMALAYIDWSAQEIGIAAALSGDAALMDAYRSGDPYLSFAQSAGAIPLDGTKATHGPVRERYKAAMLSVGYGSGPEGLANRLGIHVIQARNLLAQHRETYARFWQWSDGMVDHALLFGSTHTVFGWQVRAGDNPRSLQNYPMQANGAEILRIACILATEAGLEICAPVHDAVLIGAPAEQIEADVEAMRDCMVRASRIVLDGFELRTDAQIIHYPNRYSDPRGKIMWQRVVSLLEREIEHGGRRSA